MARKMSVMTIFCRSSGMVKIETILSLVRTKRATRNSPMPATAAAVQLDSR
jgi:hypothetical protein